MADKEYGTRFKIVQLFNGGIRIITNDLSLDILKAVMKKQSNITEISKVTKSSKSSVQANVCSMVADGILESCPDPDDSRSVIYGANCIPLISSGVGPQSDVRSSLEVIRARESESFNPHRNSMILFSNELCKHDICIHPFLLDIGSSIGSVLFKSFDMSREELIGLLAHTMKVDESYFKDIALDDVLTVRIGADGKTVTDLSYMGYVVMGMLMFYQYMRSREIYSREVRLIKVSSSEFILESERFCVKQLNNEIKPVEARDWKFYRSLDQYSIYHPDNGRTLAITNETMNLILERLEADGEHTVNSLSASLGIKAITIHASVVKMVKLGLVQQVDKNEVRNIRYRLSAHSLLCTKSEYVYYEPGTLQDHLNRFLSGESDLFETIYEIQFFLYSCAGLRHEHIIRSIAEATAQYYVEINKGISAEKFLQDTLGLYNDRVAKLKLVSVLPIRFSLECSDENGIRFRDSKVYVETLTKTGLQMITGMDYPVIVDFIQSDS